MYLYIVQKENVQKKFFFFQGKQLIIDMNRNKVKNRNHTIRNK